MIITETNEDKRVTDNLLKVIEIQNSVIWQGEVCYDSAAVCAQLVLTATECLQEVQLGAEDCKFIMEGDIYQYDQAQGSDTKRHVFLFNSLLLVTKRISKTKFQKKDQLSLENALVWNLPESLQCMQDRRGV
jgi:hypothetical protein